MGLIHTIARIEANEEEGVLYIVLADGSRHGPFDDEDGFIVYAHSLCKQGKIHEIEMEDLRRQATELAKEKLHKWLNGEVESVEEVGLPGEMKEVKQTLRTLH